MRAITKPDASSVECDHENRASALSEAERYGAGRQLPASDTH